PCLLFLCSLLEVPLKSSITSVNLHCNRLSKIEGLTKAWHIRHLDLSSNHISRIEGLGALTSLRTLNLSCNSITKVEGLNGLTNVTRLNLSYNQINDLTGLLYLHGTEYKLKHLQLHGNHLDNINHLLQCMVGLRNLRDMTLRRDGVDNPVCSLPGYREMVLQSLQQISTLDGEDRLGNWVPSGDESPLDVPGLEDFVEFLISADNNVNTEMTPAGSVPDANVASQSVVQKAKRDTDQTSESECDSAKENRRLSRIPCPRKTAGQKLVKEAKSKRSDRCINSPLQVCKCVFWQFAVFSRNPELVELRNVNKLVKIKAVFVVCVQAIVEERDQERERRWKAEQAVKRLTEQVKGLQTQAVEEKDLQSMALHTTNRLKELLLKERSDRAALQARLEELEERCKNSAEQLELLHSREDQHKRALRCLEESVSQGEALRARQKAEEMKRKQELENKCAVLKREVDILRASLRQHKDKLQQLQELLTSREEAHRKELSTRLAPGGAEFREAVGKEVAAVEQRHNQRYAEMEQKLSEARQQYTSLEDEFRMALTIEAKRFSEVKEGFELVSAQLSEVKAALNESQAKAKQSGSLVQELTSMVKEQKARIAELIKSKRDAVTELKTRVRTLEAGAEEDRRLNVQLELLKKEKSRLISQLTAQESVIEGLRAERRLWGQELAQQGASLAQDRGRLEARIEVLSTELESQKKQNEKDNDALRIKAKIVDDQTETIRKLKEAVQERDEQLRALREENLETQRRFQQQREEEKASVSELQDTVEKLTLRKEELKQQLFDKESEMDELKQAYSASSRKWQDKADLLTRLESQVKRMKEGFDAKERALLDERDKASQAHKAAVENLHSVDDAFRRQLESLQASHQAELLQLANEKQKHIEQANQRVFQVEEEMRQLLEETESNKRAMEEKMRRLTSVLRDF
uniref:Leucine-rich repeat and coiled-coil domain-containing protein 1 n=1 Tax=Astyanax mexicanus TaxID=7994 RepID=A0A8B9GRR7_ASTMX